MPFYSDDLIEEVRSRNDIVDVISNYVRLQKRGSTYFGLCPFHNEKTASFSVTPGKQMYYCFGCGAGGNVFTFLMEYENFTFAEAMQALAERAGVELPVQEYSPQMKREADRRQRLLEVNKEAGKYYYMLLRSEHGTQALDYFKKRGLSEETMRKFGLGYSDKFSDDLYRYLRNKGYEDDLLKDSGLISYDERRGGHDKFWNRAMFPIMDVHNKIIGFGGRVMGEGEPKYLNSPETKIFDKSRNLYGLNFARTTKKPQLLLCEGYMDVIALHQAGFTNAVAALGTAFTSGHTPLIKRYVHTVYLSFDSDGAGVKAALRAIPILKEAGLNIKVINMRPYKDPDEFIKALGAEEYQKRIDHAQNSFLYEIHALESQYDRSDPDGKTTFYNAVADKLLEFTDELERANYTEAVANEFQIPYDLLKKSVEKKALYYDGKPQPKNLAEPKKKIKEKKENGVVQSQKILLTWLIDEPELYQKIHPYIGKKDFIDPLCQKVAGMLFEQIENGDLNPAKIISTFEQEEEQKEVAGLFHRPLRKELNKLEKERVLNDTVKLVKKNYLDYISKNAVNIQQLQEAVVEKAKLQKMHISL